MSTSQLIILNESNIVIQTKIVNPNNYDPDPNAHEVVNNLSIATNWTYDQDLDAYFPPKKYSSWLKTEPENRIGDYEPPVAMPDIYDSDGNIIYWEWDEDTTSWVTV